MKNVDWYKGINCTLIPHPTKKNKLVVVVPNSHSEKVFTFTGRHHINLITSLIGELDAKG